MEGSGIDSVTQESVDLIFDLLADVIECINKRGLKEYYQYITKIPVAYRENLPQLFQWGAMFSLILFEVRRGGSQNMIHLKKSGFSVLLDPTNNVKYIKYEGSEGTKTSMGSNPAVSGCIPFIAFNRFNPGIYIQTYLSSLSDEATKPGVEGDLFMKPRIKSASFDFLNAEEKVLYEANLPVGSSNLNKMVGELCAVLGRPRLTNQSIRSSAVSYMRRAGLSFQVICQITNHKHKRDNHFQQYGAMEAKGFVDASTAIGSGATVVLSEATGEDTDVVAMETFIPHLANQDPGRANEVQNIGRGAMSQDIDMGN